MSEPLALPADDGVLFRQLLSASPETLPERLASLPDDRIEAILSRLVETQQRQRQERQIAFYVPVSDKAMDLHVCKERVVGLGGGNRSSKTTSCLVELVMMATGTFPASVASLWEERHGGPIGKSTKAGGKFRGPINVRVVCESLTTTLHQTILPKLKWWVWNGADEPGGERGHYGWVPKDCLIDGDWNKSWSEKLRILRVLCRDPENPAKILGESTFEFFSHDQDPSDFASGACHYVLHDEPPRFAIWRENEARCISVGGRMLLAMTWPDDPTIAVDWLFDHVYEPAQNPSSGIRWINLWSTDNRHIDQEALEAQRAVWDEQTVQVRVFGKPIRFSNRVHPLFTAAEDWWCTTCGKTTTPTESKIPGSLSCSRCKSIAFPFCHVREFDVQANWPTIWLIDPHPRKPHMFLWAQVDPADDLWVVAEGECAGDPMEVRIQVEEQERLLRLRTVRRLIDPNMGRSPSSSVRREATWQDDFDAAGLVCDLADDGEVGRQRVNDYLKPDPHTGAPRLHLHPRATRTAFQMARYIWDDYKAGSDRDQKQKAKEKYDDYPTLLKYLLNSQPLFRSLVSGNPIIHRRPMAPQAREVVWQRR